MSNRDAASQCGTVTLFLCGDVMTGRGIDQILPHPSRPIIHERSASSALDYVDLAERASDPITRPVDFAYVWGEALAQIDRRSPDLRIINLETSITTSEDFIPKGINYRMHPDNIGCLTVARVDCCVLANNHTLDWGTPGLVETLDTLRAAGITPAGAGRTVEEASLPAVLETSASRVLVFAWGIPGCGIDPLSAATDKRPGVRLLPDLAGATASRLADDILAQKRPGDMVMASIHWGHNWGYDIPSEQRSFAHRLIDSGAVDLVHGHSSHHVKGIEVYRDRLILYGCGDFIDDYEGIRGYHEYRPDLVVAYFPRFELCDGRARLVSLEMVAFRSRRFRPERVSAEDNQWLRDSLNREGVALGTKIEIGPDGVLETCWN